MVGSADPAGSLVTALRHRAVRTARAIYLGVERSRCAPVLDNALVRRLKARVTYVPAATVLDVLRVLDDAGVRSWVAGGWGVDALTGRQTRRHYDVDLVVDRAPGVRAEVVAALTGAGFREATVEYNDGLAMPLRCAWHDDDGHVVEIMPVALDEPPFGPEGAAPFARGRIANREVPCLSASLQVTLHAGYPPRAVEPHDLDLLRRHLGGEKGATPA